MSLPSREPAVTFEFHVARAARERYRFDEAWFSITGNVVIADAAATRRLAYRMNQARDAGRHPERAIRAAELHAMGLIDEILHWVAALYRREVRADAFARVLERLESRLGRPRLDALLLAFAREFPPLAVHRGAVSAEAYLAGATAGTAHRAVLLEELLLLWLANANPAFAPFRELFDDAALAGLGLAEAVESARAAFAELPPFGPDDQPLVEMLRSPAVAAPHSLWDQLDYIRTRWGHLLGDLLARLLTALDVLREEDRAWRLRFATWSEGQSPPPPDFRDLEGERERFSADREWMPRVVLMAKSTHVWLDQLARRHGREVARLDQIPDEELDRLARWGVTALWLIGLWERSPASRRIKQLCGNPDALASAYSLHDYRVAADLGGDRALDDLRARAGRRGIRLASDMVPNHMGLDSRWMAEHPDWFLSLDHSPYPAYTFHGPDLSTDGRMSVRIEDHYYDRSDAAVVFQRVDRATGGTRWVYHGNDGTFMPWNDTAQLDFLKPEVREGVIQTILHVARQFPIIRFDAAMTLARRHFQRLWYPEPGSGGAIPSRAERGLTREAFDRRMPAEFWREVVDRVAAEVPDTLLLAEAFWLMEGYFVRTLGMHRVYNSAFMNMLRDEDNAGYRAVIKNTLEFDPEILKRYVNFMNNPDERTAIDQFGNGDKYFGVCTLMVTLPGLPMLGHGQVEGFAERYGMEFRRAGRDEQPDPALVERHEREIFPLLHRRRLFAEARDFLLYDFFTEEGAVDEHVFAYSNRDGDQRALVLYHNRYARTAGWIRVSAASAERAGEERRLRRRTLGEGLGLAPRAECFCVFRDQRTGLEFVRSSLEIHERGLYADLEAYRCHVFLDFREVTSDAEHPWAELAGELAGRGVSDAGERLEEIRQRPVVAPLRVLLEPASIDALAATPPPAAGATRAAAGGPAAGEPDDAPPVAPAGRGAEALDELERRARALLEEAARRAGAAADPEAAARVRRRAAAALAVTPPAGADRRRTLATLVAWIAVREAGGGGTAAARAAERYRAFRWDRAVADALVALGADPGEAARGAERVAALLAGADSFRAAAREADGAARLLESWRREAALRDFLGVHEHAGTLWLRRESLDELLAWLGVAAAVDREARAEPDAADRAREERAAAELAERIALAAAAAGYRVEALAAHARG